MTRMVMITAAVLSATLWLARWAQADIEGSKHDFSREEWADGDKCSACHVPHRPKPAEQPPEWEPDADLQRSFAALDEEAKAAAGSGTRLCLRCHDGTIADDATGGLARGAFHRALFQGAHGTTDHPVGVDYPDDPTGYHPRGNVVGDAAVKLPEGKVECVSCHDPHNTVDIEHMLVKSNDRSALCLTCHRK